MKKPLNERELLKWLEMEKLALSAHEQLGNEWQCLISKHRIADIKIALLVLSGDLPLNTVAQ